MIGLRSIRVASTVGAGVSDSFKALMGAAREYLVLIDCKTQQHYQSNTTLQVQQSLDGINVTI